MNDAPALKKADVGIAVAGATDAARGAADIVLTEEGLSAIATAIIGARKIFQRMTTYARYTIAMTFRITFTFGLLTCIFNWCVPSATGSRAAVITTVHLLRFFPTILIVLLAVFNDGAMIALAKDRVTPSQMPSMWRIRNIFIMGVGYGIYLTGTTILLYCLAALTQFFTNFTLPSINTSNTVVTDFCTNQYVESCVAALCSETLQFLTPPTLVHTPKHLFLHTTSRVLPFTGYSPDTLASVVYPTYQWPGAVPTALQQCQTEVAYLRNSMLRSMIYLQVSVSGQALIFVVRDLRYSFCSRAGVYTYLAFFLVRESVCGRTHRRGAEVVSVGVQCATAHQLSSLVRCTTLERSTQCAETHTNAVDLHRLREQPPSLRCLASMATPTPAIPSPPACFACKTQPPCPKTPSFPPLRCLRMVPRASMRHRALVPLATCSCLGSGPFSSILVSTHSSGSWPT